MEDLNTYLRPELRTFVLAMENQLRANDHKGGWGDFGPNEMVMCALSHIDRALTRFTVPLTPLALVSLANAANYLMMAHDLLTPHVDAPPELESN